jgi:hypothetical protein
MLTVGAASYGIHHFRYSPTTIRIVSSGTVSSTMKLAAPTAAITVIILESGSKDVVGAAGMNKPPFSHLPGSPVFTTTYVPMIGLPSLPGAGCLCVGTAMVGASQPIPLNAWRTLWAYIDASPSHSLWGIRSKANAGHLAVEENAKSHGVALPCSELLSSAFARVRRSADRSAHTVRGAAHGALRIDEKRIAAPAGKQTIVPGHRYSRLQSR